MSSDASSRPRVAVVICSRDRPAFLAEAVTAAMRAVAPGDEVIVVDSASRTDATRRAALDAGARFVRCDEPGASRARNAGARATDATLLAFTDDDCLPQPGWTDAVAAALAARDVGFCVGRVVADVDVHESPIVLDRLAPRTYEYGVDPATIGHGANMAFRREAFERAGGFDDELGAGARFHGSEDQDLFWRVLRAGYRGRYEPGALVVHRAWRTRAELMAAEYRYGVGAGAFAAKTTSIDAAAGRALLRRRVWDDGLVSAARLLRRGWERPALAQVVKVAGVVAGYARFTAHHASAATSRRAGWRRRTG